MVSEYGHKLDVAIMKPFAPNFQFVALSLHDLYCFAVSLICFLYAFMSFMISIYIGQLVGITDVGSHIII